MHVVFVVVVVLVLVVVMVVSVGFGPLRSVLTALRDPAVRNRLRELLDADPPACQVPAPLPASSLPHVDALFERRLYFFAQRRPLRGFQSTLEYIRKFLFPLKIFNLVDCGPEKRTRIPRSFIQYIIHIIQTPCKIFARIPVVSVIVHQPNQTTTTLSNKPNVCMDSQNNRGAFVRNEMLTLRSPRLDATPKAKV